MVHVLHHAASGSMGYKSFKPITSRSAKPPPTAAEVLRLLLSMPMTVAHALQLCCQELQLAVGSHCLTGCKNLLLFSQSWFFSYVVLVLLNSRLSD